MEPAAEKREDVLGAQTVADGLADCVFRNGNGAYATGAGSAETDMGTWSDGQAATPLSITTSKPSCPPSSQSNGCASAWTKWANEGATCAFTGTMEVHVGARRRTASSTRTSSQPNGISQISLKEGLAAGKASIQMKGKGALLDDPVIPVSQPVTVQLFNSDGFCWEATYSAPAQKNTAGPPAQF